MKATDSEKNQVDKVKQRPEQEQVGAIVKMQYYLPHIHWVSTRTEEILERAVGERENTMEALQLVKDKMDEVKKLIGALRRSAEEEECAQIRRVYALVSFDHSSRYLNGVKLL